MSESLSGKGGRRYSRSEVDEASDVKEEDFNASISAFFEAMPLSKPDPGSTAAAIAADSSSAVGSVDAVPPVGDLDLDDGFVVIEEAAELEDKEDLDAMPPPAVFETPPSSGERDPRESSFSRAKSPLTWPVAVVVNAVSKLIKFPEVSYVVRKREAFLLTDNGIKLDMTHYFKKGFQDTPGPVVLIRTPYYRQIFMNMCCRLASEGFHVIIQDCRKRFVKNFDEYPLEGEDVDGYATLQWIEDQPFCDGNIGMFGPSYLGLTQYSVVPMVREKGFKSLKAIVPLNSASNLYNVMFPNGVLHMDLLVMWLYIMLRVQPDHIGAFKRLRRAWKMDTEVLRAFKELPIAELDKIMFKEPIQFISEILGYAETPDHPFWTSPRFKAKLCCMDECPPTSLLTGFYDCFFRSALDDIKELQRLHESKSDGDDSDLPTYRVTIGPWTHWDLLQFEVGLNEAVDWFKIHLKQKPVEKKSFSVMSLLKDIKPKTSVDSKDGEEKHICPFKIFIFGLNEWRSFRSFPPTEATRKKFFLGPERTLIEEETFKKKTVGIGWYTYNYDPKKPTPSIGGASFDLSNTGRKNQRPLEQRDDVLVFTSPILDNDICIIGPVSAEVYVWSSDPYAHFVARLCDVTCKTTFSPVPSSKGTVTEISLPLCDGLCTLTQATRVDTDVPSAEEGIRIVRVYRVNIDMAATAILLPKGSRIRLQIASAAHPRWSRHLGTEKPWHTKWDEAKSSRQIVYFGGALTSHLSLPLLPPELL